MSDMSDNVLILLVRIYRQHFSPPQPMTISRWHIGHFASSLFNIINTATSLGPPSLHVKFGEFCPSQGFCGRANHTFPRLCSPLHLRHFNFSSVCLCLGRPFYFYFLFLCFARIPSVMIMFLNYQFFDWVYGAIFLFLFLHVSFGCYNFWPSTSLEFGLFSFFQSFWFVLMLALIIFINTL